MKFNTTFFWALLGLLAMMKPLAFAQKVSYKNDQILIDNQPYALLKKSGNPLVKTFSLQNLQGQELALAKPTIIDLPNNENYIYYTLTFFPEGQQTEFENTMNFGKKLAELVVQNDLVKNNALNPDGLRKFLQVHNQKFSDRYGNMGSATAVMPQNATGLQYQTVTRDRNADIEAFGKTLKQDFKTIGNYTQTDQATRGIIVRTLRFALPDGTVVAEATFEGLDAKVGWIVTLKDNQRHQISVQANDLEAAGKIAAFLSKRYYL